MNAGQINDAYQIMNELASQALASTPIKAVDTSSFVAVGEAVLKTGYENTLKSLGVVYSKTIFSVRPYKSRFWSMEVSEDRWGAIIRKINFLYSEAEPSQHVNTDLITGTDTVPNTIFEDGNSVDMYKMALPKTMQLNFYGQQALQKHITRFIDQLDTAFRSEAEFMQFNTGVMVEFFNEIEIMDEAKARAVVLNRIAGMAYMNIGVVDLVAEYNKEFGTSYTREQLLSTNLSDLMRYMAGVIKTYSSRLEDIQLSLYHANVGGKMIPRHTPKARQKMLMYAPLFYKAESEVYSSIFNPQYLDIGAFEGVNYWQSQDDPTRVDIIPSILNTTTGAMEKAPGQVNIPYVVGLLYDEEGMGWYPKFTRSIATPVNAAGAYWNLYYHWLFSAYNDYTENAVLFVLGDGGTAAANMSLPKRK